MSAAQLVKGCPLFHEIYENEIEEIIADCYVASFEPGDAIIEQGDESTDICVLLEGEADVTVSKGGKEIKIVTLNKGDLFGEMVLINETKRTANIIAKTHCDVLVMTYDNFYHFFNKNPKVFALMVLNVTRLITKRLKNSNLIIEQLNNKIKELGEKQAA
jgi:CRP-like cAMP-binding protein